MFVCSNLSEPFLFKGVSSAKDACTYMDGDLDFMQKLSLSELSNLEKYSKEWLERCGVECTQDPKATFSLSQSPDFSLTWTTEDGCIPCYTHSSSRRIWAPYHGRWICRREKLTSLLFPILEEMMSCIYMFRFS